MGILGALFGGSKSKSTSESGNTAFPFLQQALQPAVTNGVNSLNRFSEAIGPDFDTYLKNAGFDTALGTRLRGITGAGAARGLLNSGATGRAMAMGEGDLRANFYNNWLGKMGEASQLGLGAGNLLAGAGAWSKGTSSGKSQNGILSTLFG